MERRTVLSSTRSRSLLTETVSGAARFIRSTMQKRIVSGRASLGGSVFSSAARRPRVLERKSVDAREESRVRRDSRAMLSRRVELLFPLNAILTRGKRKKKK